MANEVSLQYTKFINLNDEGDETKTSFGYRIYDDYGQTYNNTFDSLDGLRAAVNRENILDYIRDNHDEFYESVAERGSMWFNGKWIEVRKHQGDD